jgi:hypothetical protein
MVDSQDADLPCHTVNFVDDPVGASASGPQAFQLASKRVTESSRRAHQRAEHELDHGGRNLLGKASQGPLGGGGHDELPPSTAHLGGK